jgi:hypothetical protein
MSKDYQYAHGRRPFDAKAISVSRLSGIEVAIPNRHCRLWVKSAVLKISQSLPVYREKQTNSEPAWTSQLGQKRASQTPLLMADLRPWSPFSEVVRLLQSGRMIEGRLWPIRANTDIGQSSKRRS